MKNLYVLIILSLFTAIASNDEFMDRFPLDKVNDANFWTRASDVKMYADQFYTDLRPSLAYLRDNPSDNQLPQSRDTYIWSQYTIPSSGGGWGKSDWLRIRRCNYALARVANMEPTNEVQRYEAEIRFFKSYYYFEKVKKFGDVPWLDRDLQTDSEELFAPRDSRATVIANIVEDLNFAIENLPETDGNDRLTKYAAYALKAEVCLYEGTFEKYHNLGGNYEALLRESAKACEEVINSGLFEVYSTGDTNNDFFNLFVQYELKGNPEGIMIQRYLKDIRMHNQVRNLDEQKTGYTKDFAETYLCTDGLPISLSPLYRGDAVFDNEFVNRDPRMRQSIYNSSRPFRIFPDGTTSYKTLPEFNPVVCTSSYFIIKGFSPYEVDRNAQQDVIDLFTFRYGKILLEYAESKAELGECTQEVLDKSINELRDRVGMPHLTVDVGFVDPAWPNWEVPVSPLINEIRRERRIELCSEGFRWDDLVRWKAGKLLENEKTYVGALNPKTGNYHVMYPGAVRKWDNKLYLYPLPIEDLVMNTKLTQNPGWEQ